VLLYRETVLNGKGGFAMQDADSGHKLWMQIHRLAGEMESLGLNREERITRAVNLFMELPPTVRRELHNDIRMLAVDLFDMLPLIATAENDAEGKKTKVGKAS